MEETWEEVTLKKENKRETVRRKVLKERKISKLRKKKLILKNGNESQIVRKRVKTRKQREEGF